jgi:hypothetical protein
MENRARLHVHVKRRLTCLFWVAEGRGRLRGSMKARTVFVCVGVPRLGGAGVGAD